MRNAVLAPVAALFLTVAAPVGVLTSTSAAAAQPARNFVNIAVLDIAPADSAKFLELTKVESVAAVKDRGCWEANIVQSKSDPNHFVVFELYDDEAAFNARQAGERFKKYQAATSGMIVKATIRGQTVIALNSKRR